MVGDSTRPAPTLLVRTSAETFLCHSQSPSFAEPRSTEKLNETKKITENNDVGLVIRYGQKRQKPIPSDEIDEPEAKRTRGDENTFEKPLTAEKDQLASENARKLSFLLCSNIDIHEMYKALRSSASAIPCPNFILNDSSLRDTENVRNKSSVDDRQNAILGLFSRRFALKLCSETLHLGIALLDQCLELMIVDVTTIGDLAAVTMGIASKVEEINCLSIRDLIEFGLIENKTVGAIGVLERLVLTTLQFVVTVPTPLTFATYLLVHIIASPTQICMTNYLLELALLDIETRRLPSDVVGHAATCLAVTIESESNISPLKALQEIEIRLHSFSSIEMATSRSRALMRRLAELFLDAPDKKHTIYREYSTQRRYAVSLHPICTALQKTLNIK